MGSLLALALSSSERPPIGSRTVLRLAIVLLLCAVLTISVVLLLVALGSWLVTVVGRPPALALMGAAGLLVAVLGLLASARLSTPATRPQAAASCAAGPDALALSLESLTRQYPLEAVACAAAAGMFAASAEGDTLTRPLLEVALRSLR